MSPSCGGDEAASCDVTQMSAVGSHEHDDSNAVPEAKDAHNDSDAAPEEEEARAHSDGDEK